MESCDLTGVRNLLFDLGGVIMDIRRENCVKALTDLGMKGADELLGLYRQSGPFLLLEEGKMSAPDFRNEIRRRAETPLTDTQIDAAFNAFLIGIPIERLHALESLKTSYRIYMLSNTNPIMFESKIRDEFAKDGKSLEDYFDGVCLSYEEHCAKPDSLIFERLTAKFGILPEETLFFDDSQANIDAAKQMNFRTWLVAPNAEFIDVFKKP